MEETKITEEKPPQDVKIAHEMPPPETSLPSPMTNPVTANGKVEPNDQSSETVRDASDGPSLGQDQLLPTYTSASTSTDEVDKTETDQPDITLENSKTGEIIYSNDEQKTQDGSSIDGAHVHVDEVTPPASSPEVKASKNEDLVVSSNEHSSPAVNESQNEDLIVLSEENSYPGPLFSFLSLSLSHKMASFPQHQFQPHYQPQQQQQQSKSFRNLYTIDGQISQPVSYYNPTTHLQDQSQHPPYIPSFHVVGLAPGPVAANDGSDGGAELQWNYGVEPRKKRLKEQDFLENNSQISSVDFFQPRSVSTGLGLSLDNNTRMASTGDSALLSLIGDDIDRELQRHDAEIDRFLKVQGDRLQQNILEKVQATQLQTLSFVEEKVLQKLREKEAEMESINRKNEELEERMEQLTVEAGAWQQRARYNENMISALKVNLQQVYAQSRDSKEGCGDSEVDDTASCCNGRSIDFHLLCKENNDMKEIMTCKACRVNEVCMLLLPCKHLCLCKECESKLSFCPLCQASKFIGMEVYM